MLHYHHIIIKVHYKGFLYIQFALEPNRTECAMSAFIWTLIISAADYELLKSLNSLNVPLIRLLNNVKIWVIAIIWLFRACKHAWKAIYLPPTHTLTINPHQTQSQVWRGCHLAVIGVLSLHQCAISALTAFYFTVWLTYIVHLHNVQNFSGHNSFYF